MLEKVNAVEFYDVYKGVLMEFPAMVEELAGGISMALAIYSDEPIAADRFRDFCGPADPVSYFYYDVCISTLSYGYSFMHSIPMQWFVHT